MAEATEKKASEAPTYHVDRLVAEAPAFFGEPSHVVAGALARGSKKNFTLDEVEKAIDKFKKHEAEIDNPVGSNYAAEESR